jgi:hypothetical protein
MDVVATEKRLTSITYFSLNVLLTMPLSHRSHWKRYRKAQTMIVKLSGRHIGNCAQIYTATSKYRFSLLRLHALKIPQGESLSLTSLSLYLFIYFLKF